MPKFMSTHTLPPGGLTREEVCGFAQAAQNDLKVKGYRSFVNLSEGKACCILEADDSEAIATWFEKMGMPYENITRVEFEGDRGEIQDA